MLFPVQHSWRCALCILTWCLAYRREHTTISFPVNYPLNYSADWWLLLFVWVWFHGFRVYFLVVCGVFVWFLVLFGFSVLSLDGCAFPKGIIWVRCYPWRLCSIFCPQWMHLRSWKWPCAIVFQISYDIRACIPGFRLVQSAVDVISKPRTSSHAEAWSHYPWRSLVYFIQEPPG